MMYRLLVSPVLLIMYVAAAPLIWVKFVCFNQTLSLQWHDNP